MPSETGDAVNREPRTSRTVTAGDLAKGRKALRRLTVGGSGSGYLEDYLKLYRIKDWAKLFENNRTRELKKLDWVPTPNKHDGDGYTMLLSMKNGEAMFGAWNAVLQVASRCEIRGTLLRNGRTPHNASSLSRITRFSESTIQSMLEACASKDIGWIEIEEDEKSQAGAIIPHDVAIIPQEGITEGKGREGKEGIGSLDAIQSLRRLAGRLYGRLPTDAWSYEEEHALASVAKRENWNEEIALIECWRNAMLPEDRKFFPQSVAKLICNWTEHLDKARTQKVHQKPKTQKFRPAGNF